MECRTEFSDFSGIGFHIFNIKLQLIAISNCCDKSDGLSHVELRAVSSAQITFTQNIIRKTIKVEKRER